jgi:SAM-dependent methyltransferase
VSRPEGGDASERLARTNDRDVPPEREDAFSADWLALREPVDHRTRSEALLAPLVAEWRSRGWRRIVDLGSGTGSNARYLAPRLPGSQHWVLVDHDPDLLERATSPSEIEDVRRVVGNLADAGLTAVREADLVTGSALLDLVSDGWLRDLVDACAAVRAGALFTTIYDGTVSWSDEHADDARVRTLVNAHQARDKGLGGALGPKAGRAARDRFEAAGYRTWLMPSPWILDADDGEVARLLIEGWLEAAIEQSPADTDRLRAWGRTRTAGVNEGRARVFVGHLDLLALPPEGTPGR